MSSILYLNRDNVIVDIVETEYPVKKNDNGILVRCSAKEAEGYLGSDGSVYPAAAKTLQSNYTDVLTSVAVDEVPDDVEPLAWKYESAAFVENETYPKTNLELTEENDQMSASIEYIAMMVDVSI